jgi:hypothetical protein
MAVHQTHRRSFLAHVGQGMLVAGLGHSTATQLGLTNLQADEISPQRLRFPGHDRLVDLLQATPVERFLPAVVSELQKGTTLQTLVTAAALANARAFGGEDYVGFHTFMAFMPALRMAQQLPPEQQPLPVLKVLYRQAARLEESGHHDHDTLTPVTAPASSATSPVDELRQLVHQQNRSAADQLLADATRQSPETAWNSLLPTICEAPEVHRIVLAHRAWDMLSLVGPAHADTMLRQSLHYCIQLEPNRLKSSHNVSDTLATIIADSFAALPREATRIADDQWIASFTELLLSTSPEQAAAAAAAALQEGFPAAAISEAVSCAACQLVLLDPGRPPEWAQPNKPAGSVHGDSIGLHASDTAHAWKQIVAVSAPRNAHAAVILSVWCVARDASIRPATTRSSRPGPTALAQITTTDPQALLTRLDSAIRNQQQDEACAVADRCLSAGVTADALFSRLLAYACSEDGALHAEKYYWTTRDEYQRVRPAFRNQQMVALARVSASQYGSPAPGLQQALELLQVKKPG